MAAGTQVKRVVRGSARRIRRLAQRAVAPGYEQLAADRDRLFRELGLAFESVTAAHRGIADLQAEQRALRERLDATLLLAESLVPRLELLDDGLLEARRLNLRIAELTDVVTEVVLPLHDRDIDPARFSSLAPDTI